MNLKDELGQIEANSHDFKQMARLFIVPDAARAPSIPSREPWWNRPARQYACQFPLRNPDADLLTKASRVLRRELVVLIVKRAQRSASLQNTPFCTEKATFTCGAVEFPQSQNWRRCRELREGRRSVTRQKICFLGRFGRQVPGAHFPTSGFGGVTALLPRTPAAPGGLPLMLKFGEVVAAQCPAGKKSALRRPLALWHYCRARPGSSRSSEAARHAKKGLARPRSRCPPLLYKRETSVRKDDVKWIAADFWN
jgi:hypothetical protein